jgi:hypothetical protein
MAGHWMTCALCDQSQEQDLPEMVWMLGQAHHVHQHCVIDLLVGMRQAWAAGGDADNADNADDFEE